MLLYRCNVASARATGQFYRANALKYLSEGSYYVASKDINYYNRQHVFSYVSHKEIIILRSLSLSLSLSLSEKFPSINQSAAA
jgi:hypothetical protein